MNDEYQNLKNDVIIDKVFQKNDELDDYWAKMFALHIGCPCPNEIVKEKFIGFVLMNRKDNTQLTEEFVFNQLPSFINYLAEI